MHEEEHGKTEKKTWEMLEERSEHLPVFMWFWDSYLVRNSYWEGQELFVGEKVNSSLSCLSVLRMNLSTYISA
ncbi:hypothetical protein [Paenibacillus xylanilyticus]|uniref:hypothetical protein n=1 Tax=Paenibacillus xylanilyticus TaxID=248903 RepID=UPI0039A27AAA